MANVSVSWLPINFVNLTATYVSSRSIEVRAILSAVTSPCHRRSLGAMMAPRTQRSVRRVFSGDAGVRSQIFVHHGSTSRSRDITRPYTSTSHVQLVVTQKQCTSRDGIVPHCLNDNNYVKIGSWSNLKHNNQCEIVYFCLTTISMNDDINWYISLLKTAVALNTLLVFFLSTSWG